MSISSVAAIVLKDIGPSSSSKVLCDC